LFTGGALPDSVVIRRLDLGDAPALVAFYNSLSRASKRTFRPLGPVTMLEKCENIVVDNVAVADTKFDLVAVQDGGAQGARIVGWGFLWDLHTDEPVLGLAVADAFRGQGVGTALITRVLDVARERGLTRVCLTVVTDNEVAKRLYKKHGFVKYGEFVGEDGLPYFRMRVEF